MNIETILNRPSVRGLEFRLGLEAFAHKAGSALGLPRVCVHWRRDVPTAGINDNGDLYLAGVVDEATVSRAMVVKYAGYVVHELLHHKYTNFGVSSISGIQYIRVLHNAVEDGWIENTGIASGLLGNIGSLLTELVDGMTRDALASVVDWNDARQYPYILAVACRKHATVKVPCNPRLTAIFDEAAKRCTKAKSTADTLAIAEWVYDQIKQESEKPRHRPGKDDPSKGQDGPTSPDQGEDEDKGADQPSKPSKASDAPVESPENKDATEVEPKLSAGGLMADYSVDYSVHPSRYALGHEREGLPNAPVPAKLRYEVKRLFDNSGLTEFSRNRKAGSVNVHALPSVATGNDRVFKRRLDVEGVDSAVVILLDISGSMFTGDVGKKRIEPAITACRALLETLSAAGVNTAVLGFGNHVYEIKPFAMNHKKASALISKVMAAGGTNDYTALRYSHELLAKRNETRKLVFVITDGRGQPDAVRQQVNSGKALGVTTIGIGIKADVSDIYGNAVAVDDIADIGAVSFKQIKLAA
jgi:cobalamin biosynthesis protein CobT